LSPLGQGKIRAFRAARKKIADQGFGDPKWVITPLVMLQE
jgi:hypothetical protein